MRKTTCGVRRWLRAAAERCAVTGVACLVVGGALAYQGALDAAIDGGATGFELQEAAYGDDVGRVARLLARGRPVDGQDADGRTALAEAARSGATDVVKLLLSRGADVNAPAAMGMTPLMVAVSSRHADVAALLLSRGASARVRTPRGLDALTEAAIGGDARCVRLVLAAGADVNVAGRRCNPLSCLTDDQVDVARVLLAAGLDPDAPDADGLRPVDVLRSAGATACAAAVERWKEARRATPIGATALGG
jgi:ankyrin repeat protein